MAPTRTHRFEKRSSNSGMAFTILFAVVAGLVIFSCFIWGFIVPYIRKKYFPPKPSRTKYNQQLQQTRSTGQLIMTPSRNARSARNLRRSTPDVTFYNPRIQTPFPRMPSNSESIALHNMTPPGIVSPANNTSQSLFTPVRERNFSCPEQGVPRSYTLPRARPRAEQAKSGVPDRDYGDAREYILAVPEPLRVRSRTHGSQLVASSTLESLPMSGKPFASADKHLHPNKLFEQLSKQDLRDSSCSSTSMKVKEQAGRHAASDVGPSTEATDTQSSIQKTEGQGELMRTSQETKSVPMPTPSFSTDEEDADRAETLPYNASITAMHRLRTYRSLVGAPPPEPLCRAGTLTRPKTPVAMMRDIYDKGAAENKATQRANSRNDTISTFFAANSPDQRSSESSASSPPKTSPAAFTASSLSLLPTPLRIQRSDDHSILSSTRRNSIFKEELDDDKGAALQLHQSARDMSEEEEDAVTKYIIPQPTTSRSRPAPLTLAAGARRPLKQRSPNSANPPPNEAILGMRRPRNTSVQASSVYSRDTQGLSVARTPATSEFPGTNAYRQPFSPYIPSTIDDVEGSEKGTEASLHKLRDSPASAAKQKVEAWDIDIEGLNFNTSPSPSLKRALSSLGPDCESTHEASGPHRYSTISTELNPSEARLSGVIGSPLRISMSSQVPTPRNRSPAPGGVDWV